MVTGSPAVDSPGSVGWVSSQLVRLAESTNPLPLDCGELLAPIDVEYEVYGELNSACDNAILVFHALSGDAHAAGWSTDALSKQRPWLANNPGWWDQLIGPGKTLDTNRFCVICSNILGSCYGTTGPSSINPQTGQPYGLDFPVVTVSDWVRLQERLITSLGIERLHTIIGGSLGGQQALEWTLAYPERVKQAIILATAPSLDVQGVAFNAVGRHAITSDPDFCAGNYYGKGHPGQGLAAARMLGHVTYLSEESMDLKFGRRLRNGNSIGYQLEAEFEIENYLQHQGESFIQRFDANSYLYITRAMDYYNAADWGNGDLDRASERIQSRLLLVSYSTDWLYKPAQLRQLAYALSRSHKNVSYVDIPSPYGHDAFLIEHEQLGLLINSFLEGEIVK